MARECSRRSSAGRPAENKRSAAQGEQASGGLQTSSSCAETVRIALSLVLDRITKRDDLASVIPTMYRTCKYWHKELSDEGFHMRTYSLCR